VSVLFRCYVSFCCVLHAVLSVLSSVIRLKVLNKQTNSVALGPQANYTERGTATCRRNLVPTFVDRGVAWSARRESVYMADAVLLTYVLKVR
jgi:hypothetical protein